MTVVVGLSTGVPGELKLVASHNEASLPAGPLFSISFMLASAREAEAAAAPGEARERLGLEEEGVEGVGVVVAAAVVVVVGVVTVVTGATA